MEMTIPFLKEILQTENLFSLEVFSQVVKWFVKVREGTYPG